MYSHRLRFGSEDSIDEDVLYVFESMPSFANCQAFCGQGEDNRNIVTVVNGVIEHCFKGIPDETNNALLATYHLHEQECENPVTKQVERNILLKTVRATRIVLSWLSRSKYRPLIKPALKSNNQEKRLQALSSLDFDSIEINLDSCKSIAFQLGQSLALNQGNEIYSKRELKQLFPELIPFLDRAIPQSLLPLNELRDRFLDSMSEINVECDGSLNLFSVGNNFQKTPVNEQANGMVIDLRPPERCVAFPQRTS